MAPKLVLKSSNKHFLQRIFTASAEKDTNGIESCCIVAFARLPHRDMAPSRSLLRRAYAAKDQATKVAGIWDGSLRRWNILVS